MGKATEERMKRIELMAQMLREEFGKTQEDSIPYDTFLAKFCLATGVSKRTAEEYLSILSDTGEVIEQPPIQSVFNMRIFRKR